MKISWRWLAEDVYSQYTVQTSSYLIYMKPGTPALHSSRLLDPLRERIRCMHYSLSTENVYVCWVRYLSAGLLTLAA